MDEVGREVPDEVGARRPLLGSAAVGAIAGGLLVGVAMVVLRSSAGGSSSGPGCTMERTLECMPETAGRAFDIVLVLLVVLAGAIGALGLGLLGLLVAWLVHRNRPEPPGRGLRVLVGLAAGFAVFGATAIVVVFAS